MNKAVKVLWVIAKLIIAIVVLILLTYLINHFIVYPNMDKRINNLEQQVNKDLPEGEKIEINVTH